MTSPRLHRPVDGFTLIELLTVIAIIGILAAIIIPTVGRVRESARSTVCKSNLRQIGMAVQVYGNERGFYPPSIAGGTNPSGETSGQAWVQFLRPYFTAKGTSNISEGLRSNLAVCPSRFLTPPAAGEENRSTYSVHPRVMPDETSLTAVKKLIRMGQVPRPSAVILAADGTQQAHGGANSNFYSVDGVNNTTADSSGGSTAIDSANDSDPQTGGYFRYRHADTLNVVFVDGHVGAFKKNEVQQKNISIFY